MKKGIAATLLATTIFMFVTQSVSAHAVVKPSQAPIASYQTFSLGVPNEKSAPTISVRLIVPEGVTNVMPNVKPGWTITVKKNGEGETAQVTEVIWSGGVIPVGQRDSFDFSVKVPATEGAIYWKAYQTYKDGMTVSWDQMGESKTEGEDVGPASKTEVINDLTKSSPAPSAAPAATSDKTAVSIAIAAFALAVVAFVRSSHSHNH